MGGVQPSRRFRLFFTLLLFQNWMVEQSDKMFIQGTMMNYWMIANEVREQGSICNVSIAHKLTTSPGSLG